MQHQGGQKPGRKPGSGNKKKSAVILTGEYDSGKIMPLEVQLEAMRLHWEEWIQTGSRDSLKEATTLAQAAGLTATRAFRQLISAPPWKQATRSRHCSGR